MEDITLGNFKSILNSKNKYFKKILFAENIEAAIDEPFLLINKYLEVKDDNFVDILFEDCKFEIPIRITGINIKGFPQFFKNCVFNKRVYLGNIKFDKLIFENVIFNDECIFSSCNFLDGLIFTETIFNNNLSFVVNRRLKVMEIKDAFFRCEFNGITNFNSVSFGILNLSDSSIGEKICIFNNCSFNLLALFRRLNLKSNIIFLNVDLTNCSFLNSNFAEVLFASISINIKEHIDYKFLKSIIKEDDIIFKSIYIPDKSDLIREVTENSLISEYKIFEKNFDNKKQFEIAGDFHQASLDIERQFNPTKSKKTLLWLYKTFSNYGESYKKSIIWFSLILVFFSILYLFTGLDYINNEKHSIIYYFKCSNINNIFNDYGLSFLYSFINSFPAKRDIDILKAANGYTIFFSTIQTVIQSILITLFIIALRRKFRR
jgi:hypothetical protein